MVLEESQGVDKNNHQQKVNTSHKGVDTDLLALSNQGADNMTRHKLTLLERDQLEFPTRTEVPGEVPLMGECESTPRECHSPPHGRVQMHPTRMSPPIGEWEYTPGK